MMQCSVCSYGCRLKFTIRVSVFLASAIFSLRQKKPHFSFPAVFRQLIRSVPKMKQNGWMWMNVHDYSDIITANCCTGTVQDWTKLHRPRGGSSHNCHLPIKPSTSLLSSWRSCHGNCHQVQILQRSYLIPDIPNTTKNITCKTPHTPTQHPDPKTWHLTSDLIFCWQTMRKYFNLVSKSMWDPSWVVSPSWLVKSWFL